LPAASLPCELQKIPQQLVFHPKSSKFLLLILF